MLEEAIVLRLVMGFATIGVAVLWLVLGPARRQSAAPVEEGHEITKRQRGKLHEVIERKNASRKQKSRSTPRWAVGVPVHSGVPYQSNVHLDVFALCNYMPPNTLVLSPKKREPAAAAAAGAAAGAAGASEEPASPTSASTTVSSPRASKRPSTRLTMSRASLRQSLSWAQQTHQHKMRTEAMMVSKLPVLPGCNADGPAAKELAALFPDTPMSDLVRFLVARKADVKAAAEMLVKAKAWHKENFPLAGERRRLVEAAFSSNCFFVHGQAKDGTPVLYMRGALYDGSKAPPEAYVLAAAHAIQFALSRSTEPNVTVVVHAVNVPGAPNDNADLNFIKGFISVLSDNFPERLKRLAIYPFPWYGRAIWSILKVFVDKRTQGKVMIGPTPEEMVDIIDPECVPEVCGGKCREALIDMRVTLDEQ